MLIRAADLLAKLATQKTALVVGTFDAPPDDYAGFMRAVGRYQAIDAAEAIVRDLSRQEDDK